MTTVGRLCAAVFVVALVAGCSSPGAAPSTSTSSSQTSSAAPSCTHARGLDSGVHLEDGYYLATDGGVWRESNNLTGLQEIRTCEGPSDTRVLPP